VSIAHPLATAVAQSILMSGGSAVDDFERGGVRGSCAVQTFRENPMAQ
jgi:hypothetical protein